jgi:hypothetical protein
MAIHDNERKLFELVKEMITQGQPMLMEVFMKDTGERRLAICTVGLANDDDNRLAYQVVPVALLFWDNPFELVAQPATLIGVEGHA